MVVNFRNNIKTNTEPSEKGDSQGLKKEVSKPIFEKKRKSSNTTPMQK